MKKFLSIPFIVALIGFSLTACDKIEPPYKETGGSQPTDDTRKVLLEDYTGHTCVNCPTGARLGHQIVDLYDGQVIMLGVHAGFFAEPKPAPFDNDYRTEAGTAWDNFFGISAAGNPMGMVNRQSSQGVYNVASAKWATAVSLAAEQKAALTLDINTSWNNDSRSLKIDLESKMLQSLNQKLMVIACIVEDSIVSAQRNNDPGIGIQGTIPDYVHRHVLRGSINGNWGEELAAAGTAVNGASFSKSYSITSLNSAYKAEHVTVLAMVYDAETYEVLQVEEKHIK